MSYRDAVIALVIELGLAVVGLTILWRRMFRVKRRAN